MTGMRHEGAKIGAKIGNALLGTVLLVVLFDAPKSFGAIEAFVTTHHVVLWFHHSKVVVTYDNERVCPWCNGKEIGRDTEGCWVDCYGDSDCTPPARRCMTIGGGSDGGWLHGEFNRPSDIANKLTSRPKQLSVGTTSELLGRLRAAVDAHEGEWSCLGDQGREDERLDYDLLPGIGDGFNSNSFVAGILEAAGVDAVAVKPPKNVPGYRKPVGSDRFSLEEPAQCR